jgi:hypothetical protein
MTNELRIKSVDGGYRINGIDSNGVEVVADWTTYATREEAEMAMAALTDAQANERREYRYATDSEAGTIEAYDFASASRKLDEMLTDEAIEEGAWGWVEDVDGERYTIGSR